ncbi:uncharacterized protein MELLADRAFT_113476 [Melampsora larici-populina 98AG31]|uniref:Uncharacterized protein n=1 Tax=Melampsora larici-populina (strain 98AG31 / pathotype 3-4-7) TaxID=747676 RepID=F4SA01_MELLP|nr:uncharacterized protein MELLADRAFT_113476 [Melampsora larici-populina 98AG31]EGF98540.1 hypothetical protein MELLADRAFT_113476 [Melampsora larici-populina 98AG31]
MSCREGYVECSSSSMVNRVSSVSLEADVNCSGRGSSSGAITSSTSDADCTGRDSPSENITSSTNAKTVKVSSFYCDPVIGKRKPSKRDPYGEYLPSLAKKGRHQTALTSNKRKLIEVINAGPSHKRIRLEEQYRAETQGQNPIPFTFTCPPIMPNTVYCAAPSKVSKVTASDEMVIPLIPKGLTTSGRIGKFCVVSEEEDSDSQEPEDSLFEHSGRVPNIGSPSVQSIGSDSVQVISSDSDCSKSAGSSYIPFGSSSNEPSSSNHSNVDDEQFIRQVTPVDQQEKLPMNLLPFTNPVTNVRITPEATRTYNWLRECDITFGKGSNQIKAKNLLKDAVLFGVHNVTSDITPVDIWTFLKARLDIAQTENVRAVLKVRQPFHRLRYNVWVSPDLANGLAPFLELTYKNRKSQTCTLMSRKTRAFWVEGQPKSDCFSVKAWRVCLAKDWRDAVAPRPLAPACEPRMMFNDQVALNSRRII